MKPKSTQKATNQVLGAISVDDVRAFLMDSLNLPNPIDYPGHRPQFERWLRRWQRLFTFRSEQMIEDTDGNQRLETTAIAMPRKRLEEFAPDLRTALRRVWHETDPRQRDWYLFRLRAEHHRMVTLAENPDLFEVTAPGAAQRLLELQRVSKSRGGDESQQRAFLKEWTGGRGLDEIAPHIGPFEAAVYWLQLNQNLMVYCAGPVCPAPYFFRTEKGQKYCSPECANPARKAAKLKWWNENRKA